MYLDEALSIAVDAPIAPFEVKARAALALVCVEDGSVADAQNALRTL